MQQYDRRGNPENHASRQLDREFRMAQNDVLTSVGVCIDERAKTPKNQTQFAKEYHSIEKLKTRSIRRENEIGLSIAAADLGIFCVVTFFLMGLRNRVQASHSNINTSEFSF